MHPIAPGSTGYKEPEWATVPSSSLWRLSEIKGGVEVEKHNLSGKATTILGRAADQVDVPLLHESISRQHARISFDAQGNPWLRDLQSSHGTFVNKKRLPSAASGKVESNSHQKGSRGVRIFVGDMLKFGASSRYFLLEGPPHQSSEKKALLEKLGRSKQDNRQAMPSVPSEPSSKATNAKDEGISWGIDMDDNLGNDMKVAEQSASKSSGSIELDPMKIPDKFRKEFDKLNAMKYKLTNLETEDSRIHRKGGDLSEGQQRQLERNAEREATLRKSIREKEELLREKLNGKSGERSSKRNKAENHSTSGDFEEEDDYFDRTKNDSANKFGSNVDYDADETESEETLTSKWKHLFEEQNRLKEVALRKAKSRVDALKKELEAMMASDNEEDAFFVRNDLQLALETKKKIESSLTMNKKLFDQTERLLKIVNPKIYCDRVSGYIGEGKPQDQKPPLLSTKLHNQNPDKTQTSPQLIMMPPPEKRKIENTEDASMPPPLSMHATSEKVTQMTQHETLPSNKRKRIIGVAVPPNKHSPIMSDSSAPEPRNSQPSVETKHRGTLSFLNHSATTKMGDGVKNMESMKEEADKQRGQKSLHLQTKLDVAKIDQWRAPKGQDGSGKTKLNEKFAGRY